MAKTAAELAVEREKIAAGLDSDTIAAVVRALGSLSATRGKLVDAQADVSKDLKLQAMKDISRVEASMKSNSAAARMRGIVELRKLAATAPIDFAKAAYLPDRGLLDRIDQALTESGQSESEGYNRTRAAWQEFYRKVQPDAGNIQGTYDAMMKQYPPDGPNGKSGDPSVFVPPGDAFLSNKYRLVQEKLATEKAAAAQFDGVLRALTEPGAAYEDWSAEQGLDPNSDETARKYAVDMGLDKLLPAVQESGFMQTLKGAVQNPEAFKEELARSDVGRGIEELDKEMEFLKSLLPKQAQAGRELTDREKMGLWLAQPGTRWWAEQKGLKVGQVRPATPELQKDIEAGVFPEAHVLPGGLIYLPAPDDKVALRKAYNELHQRPERQVFRAMGLGRGARTPVEIDLKPPDERVQAARGPKLVEVAAYPGEGGTLAALGKLADGSYVGSSDMTTWKPIPAEAAASIEAANKLAYQPVTDEQYPLATKLPKKTVKGVRRDSYYNDEPGSVRFVDESGKEHYIAPEDIAEVREPGLSPGAHRPQPLDAIRKAQAAAVMRRTGLTEEQPEPKLRQAEAPAAKALPTERQFELEQRAQAERKTPEQEAQAGAIAQADKALEASRARLPVERTPAPPPTPAPAPTNTGTKKTSTVTPTESDDARRKQREAFRRGKASPAATSYVQPAE